METKRQEEIKKLMQMPEETITNLSESEADQYGRLALMFYKKTGDESYRKKAEQIRAGQKELPENVCAMPFSWSMKQSVGKRSAITRSLNGWKRKPKKDCGCRGKRRLFSGTGRCDRRHQL